MKRLIVALVLVSLAGFTFAAPRGAHDPYAREGLQVPPYVEQELEELLAENAATEVGALSGADLKAALERLSIAAQQEAFVARSKAMSFVLPGLGQMVNEDYTRGSLFLLADLAALTGTVLGGYFLLPDNLRFDQLNYFKTNFGDIRTAWEGHSFVDYLPSMAVLAGGGVVMAILGKVASEHAGRLAERSIADGKITFQPRLLAGWGAWPGPDGGPWQMGWGMGVRY